MTKPGKFYGDNGNQIIIQDWTEIRSVKGGFITGFYSPSKGLLDCKLDGEFYSPINLEQAMSICGLTEKYINDLHDILGKERISK